MTVPDDAIPTHIWVTAGIRRCSDAAIPAVLVHRGDPHRGTVMLKLNRYPAGCQVLEQRRDLDGVIGWAIRFDAGLVPEGEADDLLQRAIGRDPDLWVIEIEHPDGWHPFEGPVLP